MRRLLQPKNQMAMVNSTRRSAYLAVWGLIRGEVDPLDLHKSMLRIRERQLANFVPWGPADFNMSIARNSPHLENASRVNGLLLVNHTSVGGVRGRFGDLVNGMLIIPPATLALPQNVRAIRPTAKEKRLYGSISARINV